MEQTLLSSEAPAKTGAPIGFIEFVALIASLMALVAIGIDSMLPALPAIGRSLDVVDPNRRQFVITAFVAGLGLAQVVHGPLADRFGRRAVLLLSLGAYAIANALAAVSGSFVLLLAARAAGGASIAATRVTVIALVRDCYHGRAMARVMSIAFTVFMIVPILAPSFGEAILLFANWRGIFWVITGCAFFGCSWFYFRMPETLPPEDRLPISISRIVRGWRMTAGDRWSLGYTLATTALMGALYGYLNSIQQIIADTFGRPELLGVVFAASAATMAVANLLNARLVMRLGTRLISHGAVATMVVISVVHLLIGWTGAETLAGFIVLQALTMACFGLATSNFSAMAMENLGHIAGTASSVQGFVTGTVGALLGAAIGQSFDGTTTPLVTGFLLAGLAAFTLAAVAERGRLFRRT